MTSSAQLRQAGNALYGERKYAEALDLYTAAAAAAPADPAAGITAEAVRDRALALSNRAASHLALGAAGAALDDTWEVQRLLELPGSRDWQRLLRQTDWVHSAYSKVLLRRAAALDVAVGCSLGALPALAWIAARTGSTAEEKAAANRATAPPTSAGILSLPAVWTPLSCERADPPPCARRGAACAALGGVVYLLLGDASNDATGISGGVCSDLWALRLPEPPSSRALWARLGNPSRTGGPGASAVAVALACEATGELAVVDAQHYCWAYKPASDAWRAVGALGSPDAKPGGREPATIALSQATLFALSCGAGGAWSLASLSLSEPAATARHRAVSPGHGRAAPSPRRRTLAWADADGSLLVWGGAEDAPSGVPGHPVHAPSGAPLAELWRIALPAEGPPCWARVRADGGGAPPVAATHSSLVPLGAGRALLYGGVSEHLPRKPPTRMGEHPTARFLNETHLYLPGQGWRRLHASPGAADGAPQPQPAAAASLAFDASSGRLFVAGGFNTRPASDHADGVLPFNSGLFELHCAPLASEALLEERRRAARAHADALWASLKRGQPSLMGVSDRTVQNTLKGMSEHYGLSREEFVGPSSSAAEFDRMLVRADALAASRPRLDSGLMEDGYVIWTVSWNSFALSPTPPRPGVWDVSIVGHDWQSNRMRRALQVPQRVDLMVSKEPTAADLAWALLIACTKPGSPLASPADRSRLQLQPCVPCRLRLAARTAHLLDALSPLLDRLGIAVVVEPWAEAAISALRSKVSPYGDNQLNSDTPGRCKSCWRIAPKKELLICTACCKIRYCNAACSGRDWEGHRPCCSVLSEKKYKGGAFSYCGGKHLSWSF